MKIDHVDVEALIGGTCRIPDVEDDLNDFEVPDNPVKFEITEEDIREALMYQSFECEAEPEIEVPD